MVFLLLGRNGVCIDCRGVVFVLFGKGWCLDYLERGGVWIIWKGVVFGLFGKGWCLE